MPTRSAGRVGHRYHRRGALSDWLCLSQWLCLSHGACHERWAARSDHAGYRDRNGRLPALCTPAVRSLPPSEGLITSHFRQMTLPGPRLAVQRAFARTRTVTGEPPPRCSTQLTSAANARVQDLPVAVHSRRERQLVKRARGPSLGFCLVPLSQPILPSCHGKEASRPEPGPPLSSEGQTPFCVTIELTLERSLPPPRAQFSRTRT
jgi:hypothetical protein